MTDAGVDKKVSLAALRGRIDAIDEEIHRLLIARSDCVEALVAAKKTQEPGTAFRPGREADVMRRLADRHHGALPLTTVEHLWREIITTFTLLQAPFKIHVDNGGSPGELRDLARFYFGFTVDIVAESDAGSVVEAVADSHTDLGLIPISQPAGRDPWWRQAVEKTVQVMALVPFLAGADRPFDIPAVIVSKPILEPVTPDRTAIAWTGDAETRAVIEALGGTLLGEAARNTDFDFAAGFPNHVTVGALCAAAEERGHPASHAIRIGGYFEPVHVDRH